MKINRSLLLIVVVLVALAYRSDGQPSPNRAEQLRLAGVMPRGAVLYLQVRDLAQLLKTWVASPVREQFYKGPGFAEFSRSNIYLKLQDRRKDFEKALGFGLDEGRLAELAGGTSAIAIYDIGNLEMVFVTEVARERAVATALFKQVPQFQERTTGAAAYYVREVTTDGGRLSQQFCFAYVAGRLVVTTTEGLMIRALGNAKSAAADSLLSDVMATAERSAQFRATDISMWLDQTRLNRSRHFNSYWLHRNAAELSSMESGLLDLRITPQGLSEQRWFVMGAGGTGPVVGSLSGEQVSALVRFAPADAHLIQVHPASGPNDHLAVAVRETLFGRLPAQQGSPAEIPDRTRSTETEADGSLPVRRYSRLDTRFDKDVDDEQASGVRAATPSADARKAAPVPAESRFDKDVKAILTAAGATAYCEVIRSKSDAGKPFVRFERALIIEMGAATAVDRRALERAITDELRARFVVAGVEPQLTWQDDAEVRYVAQALLDQGAAYSISGSRLVLASTRELARDILQSGSAQRPATAATVESPVGFYALVRVADAKPVFDKLMSKLDGRIEGAVARAQDEETPSDVKFFSENISSLLSATSIREMRVQRHVEGPVMIERLNYSW